MTNWKRWIGIGALAAVMAIGAVWQVGFAAQGTIKPPFACPDVYDPVICEDGRLYPNACVASLSGVGGCVRTGGAIE